MSDQWFHDQAAALVAALQVHVTPQRSLRDLLRLPHDDLPPLLSPYFAEMFVKMPKAFEGVRHTAVRHVVAATRPDVMRDLVQDELRFSATVILSREEVVPRFRIEVAGEAGYLLLVPLPDDLRERQWRMSLVSAFMAWKGAHAFVMSTELIEPDAAVSIGVNRSGVLAGLRMILRKPLSVGPVQWLDRSQVGDEIPALLPPKSATVSASMLADLQRVFGPQGEFKVERVQ